MGDPTKTASQLRDDLTEMLAEPVDLPTEAIARSILKASSKDIKSLAQNEDTKKLIVGAVARLNNVIANPPLDSGAPGSKEENEKLMETVSRALNRIKESAPDIKITLPPVQLRTEPNAATLVSMAPGRGGGSFRG